MELQISGEDFLQSQGILFAEKLAINSNRMQKRIKLCCRWSVWEHAHKSRKELLELQNYTALGDNASSTL